MPKDRRWQRRLGPNLLMVIERSSKHPIEYVILLLLERDGRSYTVRTFDNAHATTEHHEHRYIGTAKQEPIVTYGPTNSAMHAAEAKLMRGWSVSYVAGKGTDEHNLRQDRRDVHGCDAQR
jgi:hypothetical protein